MSYLFPNSARFARNLINLRLLRLVSITFSLVELIQAVSGILVQSSLLDQCPIASLSVEERDVIFGHKVGQIGTKFDK